MSDIIEIPEFHQLNADEFLYKNTVKQDVSQIIADNKAEAEKSNGFSDGRTMRKVASLSTTDYLIALQNGYELDSEDPQILQKELRRYLASDEGRPSQTVRHILTPYANANIIIK